MCTYVLKLGSRTPWLLLLTVSAYSTPACHVRVLHKSTPVGGLHATLPSFSPGATAQVGQNVNLFALVVGGNGSIGLGLTLCPAF